MKPNLSAFQSFFHQLKQGNSFEIHEFLGAHQVHVSLLAQGIFPSQQSFDPQDPLVGFSFCVWAPNASFVAVVGAFNDHQPQANPMYQIEFDGQASGYWFCFIQGLAKGESYQYLIKDAQGHTLPLKSDPVAFYATLVPQRPSITHGLPSYLWEDQAWIANRKPMLDQPLSIYELHVGSWKQGLSYRALADELIPYVKEMGFNAIELMPITEYPFDGSWGYQTLGLFCPTSRYGQPADLMYLINRCHLAGLFVILDWVPGHFPLDDHGLAKFDGTCLYEHLDPKRGFHPDWHTALYQYQRYEVKDFLISSACYWLKYFHFDGLRVDAVASMLYLDYSRRDGEWIPNVYGGREHLEAIDFIKTLNEVAYGKFPHILMIAEESTAWPKVSFPTFEGGLGFGYKWNMGWMNDTLHYMKTPVHERKYHHHRLNFGLQYAYHEHFILAISHDEVVHGKGSLLNKMHGDDQIDRYRQLCLYYCFLWTHPGKKSLFMGQEIAQSREWSESRSLDWFELENPLARAVQSSVKALNLLYLGGRALYELDDQAQGFEWVLVDDAERSLISYLRRGRRGQVMLVVLNFSDRCYEGERVKVPVGRYRMVFDSLAGIDGGGQWEGMGMDGDLVLPRIRGYQGMVFEGGG